MKYVKKVEQVELKLETPSSSVFLSSRHPEIFRDVGVWRSEYESYGPEVWEKDVPVGGLC